MLYPWHNVIFHPYLISLKLISFLLTTYLLCLVTCFSTDSRHTYEYKVSSSSCRIVPIFVWGGLHKKNEKKLARSFNFTFCFIDNVLSLNNYRCGDFVELEVRNTTDTDRSVSHLDIHIEIDSERRLRTKLYDKRDDFNFPIVNFSFIFSNIPAAPAYGVYISQLIQYVPLVVNTSWSSSISWIITWFTRRLQLVERELFTLPEHMSSLPLFSGIHVL